mmetsp:Transcript_37249/g.6662  ORF Transcript_37249/g.6662 Transcript_37249/m.6662 type:complete len:92 (-) Transcript_37249:1697-1972(-)
MFNLYGDCVDEFSCDPRCDGCTGPYNGDCIECADFTDDELDGRSPYSKYCLCSHGTYFNGDNCEPCDDPCNNCKGASDYCVECIYDNMTAV